MWDKSCGRPGLVGGGGLLGADGPEGHESLGGAPVQVRLPDAVALARQEVPQGDEVAEDEPEHDVLAVQAHQQFKQGEGDLAQLKIQERLTPWKNVRNKLNAAHFCLGTDSDNESVYDAPVVAGVDKDKPQVGGEEGGLRDVTEEEGEAGRCADQFRFGALKEFFPKYVSNTKCNKKKQRSRY